MTRTRRSALLVLAILAVAMTAAPRVISYSPYTDHAAYPAYQARTNRFFALVEATPTTPAAPSPSVSYGQLVVYDSTGEQPPRVVFPPAGDSTVFTLAAVRESAGVPTILVQAADSATTYGFYLSTDGGSTWKKLDLPAQTVPQILATGIDTGGPFAASRYSPVRTGTAAVPFVVVSGVRLYGVNADGTTRVIYEAPAATSPLLGLGGSNAAGTQFIVRTSSEFIVAGLDGTSRSLGSGFISPQPRIDGFIATDGSVYLEERSSNASTGRLWLFRNGSKELLSDVSWGNTGQTPNAFLAPNADFSGAWIINRFSGPTVLYKHTPDSGKVKQWEDITAPEVEALHSGASGSKVLIQVHRPRPAVDQRIFKDPALAVWNTGDPAPRAYDELYMNEQWNKGFVHLDVETIESGEPFVFDAGSGPTWGGGIIFSPGVPPPPSSGGSDVMQEWGVVRASLRQRLILPSIGRMKGNFGSDWASDVIIQNPLDAPQKVKLSLIESASGCSGVLSLPDTTYTLAAHEIRLFPDVMSSVFMRDTCSGAMVIDPDAGVTVTSRAYTKGAKGTFGFGMNAVDALAAAASPRFPITFSGAFPGTDYRTNLAVIDTSGHGSEISLAAAGRDGLVGPYDVSIKAAAGGHQQINGVTGMVGMTAFDTGALIVTPKNGSAIAAVYAIDNRTNDSTYFPPDLPSSSMVRTIPAIGHLDGANNSKFRSDLYLYNPSAQPRMVLLQAKAWDVAESPAMLQLTLLAHEARIIKDALYTVFGKKGIARLRFSGSTNDSSGVRVTSRTYNVDPDGGTYGFLMPPLNNFQIGGGGDTLEILGAVADPKFRVNVGLVELNGWPSGQNVTARVEIVDATGKQVDAFTVNLASAGGMQLNDIFNARGLTVAGPVLIRISPATGTIGAYATMTDNGTNDSVYLAANLAAKE